MAGRGRAPQMQQGRERDERRRASEMKRLPADNELRGPDLPVGDWHPRTLDWWETWRRSPMAATFIDADWSFLLDTALLHSEMWNGEAKHAAEIRLRVGKLAGTPEDRLRLRIEVDTEVADSVKPVRMSKARKDRLLSLVDDE
jgi:hypothetical protein